MRFDGNGGSAPNYEPNSFGGPTQDARYTERPKMVSGTVARHDHRSDADYYSQPGNLFRLMPADAKQRLIDNIVSSLGNGVPQRIQELQIQPLLQSGSRLRRWRREGSWAEHRRDHRQETSQRRGLNANNERQSAGQKLARNETGANFDSPFFLFAETYRLRVKRTTSLLMEPREKASLLPSADKEIPKIRPELKCVSCTDGLPFNG